MASPLDMQTINGFLGASQQNDGTGSYDCRDVASHEASAHGRVRTAHIQIRQANTHANRQTSHWRQTDRQTYIIDIADKAKKGMMHDPLQHTILGPLPTSCWDVSAKAGLEVELPFLAGGSCACLALLFTISATPSATRDALEVDTCRDLGADRSSLIAAS